MALMVEELKAFPKTEFRYSQVDKSNNANIVRNAPLLEALAKKGSVTSYIAEDGHMKIKILVKKQDLEQIMRKNMNKDSTCSISKILPRVSSSLSSSLSSSKMERRLYDLMKRKRVVQANKGSLMSNWKPTLQSISEEH